MNREKRSEVLKQIFVLATIQHPPLMSRCKNKLIVNMEGVRPYTLFTSILSSLGENPLAPLRRVQELLNTCREIYGVEAFVFQLKSPAAAQYIEVDIVDCLDEPWMMLGDTSKSEYALPKFQGVEWKVVK